MRTMSIIEAVMAAYPDVRSYEVTAMFKNEDELIKFARECAASVGAKLVLDVRPEDYLK